MTKMDNLILTEHLIKKKDKLMLANASHLVKVEWMERRDQHG